MSRRFYLLLIVCLCAFFYFYPQPETKAFDPVTIAMLTPVAIQGAKVVMPYILPALQKMGATMLKAGVNLFGIFRLPLGLLQTLFLFPFGDNFSSGLKNMGKGIIAPFKFAFYVIMIPVSPFGLAP